MRTHTGEQPYQCTKCDRKFSHISSKKKHERTHVGEKLYSSTECKKKFSESTKSSFAYSKWNKAL